MKIDTCINVKIEISLLELVAIKKLIGYTSATFRIKTVGLTEDESIALEEMYEKIADTFSNF
jgi:hypothetical protein